MSVRHFAYRLLSALNPLRWIGKTLRHAGLAHDKPRPAFKRILAVVVLFAVWALLIDISPF